LSVEVHHGGQPLYPYYFASSERLAGRRLRSWATSRSATASRCEKRTEALASLGIENVFDLLTVYPRRYIDRTKRVDLSDLTVGEEAAVFGEVKKVSSRRTNRKGDVEVSVADDGGSIKIVFSTRLRERQLPVASGLFFAKVGEYKGSAR